MSELEKMVKNVLLGGVGAVATAVEKTGEIAKSLVDKGARVLEENRDKTDALKQKGQKTLDSIGGRFSALTDRIRSQLTQTAEAPKAPAGDLRDEAEELESLEAELRKVEDLMRGEQETAETAEKEPEAPKAADPIADLADKAASFLNPDELGKAADHLAEASDRLFRKIGDAVDGALNPEKPPIDTEALLTGLQRRLEDFGKRLEASRQALNAEKKPETEEPAEGEDKPDGE